MRWTPVQVLLLSCLLGLAGCASAPKTPASPDPPPRYIPAEVAAEFERSVAGWNSGRLDAFVSVYAENATFALKDSYLQGVAAIREYYAPQFRPFAARGTLVLEELNVEVLSPDLVLVRGVYRNTQGGEVNRGTTTLVMRYFLGHWRIIHDHST